MMVVSCDPPIKTTADLVKAAKENPGNMNYASTGSGSTGNIMGEMCKLATGTHRMHIPSKGKPPPSTGIPAGHTQITFVSPVQSPYVKSDKPRPCGPKDKPQSD